MSAVEFFNYGSVPVRVVSIDGQPWFVARDVAAVLGYADATSAVRQHCKGVANHHPLRTAGGVQQLRVIPESDVMRMIVSSRLPDAQRFERWVFEEVLPAIRRTGSYGAAQVDPTTPQGMRLVLEAATAALAELDVARPKAEAWDELASAKGDYSVADAAKILARAGIDTGQQRLFKTLHEFGWIYRSAGRWQAYQWAVDGGDLAHKIQAHYHPNTSELVQDTPQIRVTAKGLRRLRDRIRAAEPLPELTG
ncbi:hypothetical protein Leucomu_11255 [Leucobacter muris]|uniref:Bro-N domain-containing protein n=1 Tax=Leucobacter muris TaxID=1935379 RepID=A0ABX5QHB0_9MICO|nr:phage antirepressor KilAC domain-containing protein [Leucobacter muris]QAB18415.1 hypothetical protein Leucomu_11255 [Leucobacter muris]